MNEIARNNPNDNLTNKSFNNQEKSHMSKLTKENNKENKKKRKNK